MRISTRTRYGVRLMLELGLSYENGLIFLKDIAKKEDISEKYLSQIIIPLKAAGLVNSFRGARGGYILAKAPTEITLKDIFEILEGNLALVGCINNPSECSRVPVCITRDIWCELDKVIAGKLGSITLEDLVTRFERKQEEIQENTIAWTI